MEAIRNYVEALFAALPQNADTQRIKADMLANLEEKYQALLDSGKNEAEATGIVIASIGSVEDLREEFGLADNGCDTSKRAPLLPPLPRPRSDGTQPDPTVAQEYGRYQARKHAMIAVAVALFILAPFTCAFFEDTLHLEEPGTFLFFVMIAAGVALCILSGRKDDYYRELYGLGCDEENDNGQAGDDEKRHPISTLFASIAFPVAAAIYVCIGVFFDLWHPGWMIFLGCTAITAAIAAWEEYRKHT